MFIVFDVITLLVSYRKINDFYLKSICTQLNINQLNTYYNFSKKTPIILFKM